MKAPKILLIEDDRTMVTLLGRVLSLDGFQPILTAELTQISIIDQIKCENPDAILMDVNIGGLDTYELIKNIHDIYSKDSPPILMISGSDLKLNCLQAGADGFLMKPFNPSDMLIWFNVHCKKDTK